MSLELTGFDDVTGDDIYTWANEVASLFTGGASSTTEFAAGGADYVKDFGEPGTPVTTGGDGNTKGILSGFKRLFSWDEGDTKANAAKVSVVGGAISGLGAGYFNNQKLQKETELMERKISLDESQAALKASNQNLGGVKFTPPSTGLIFSPALYQKRKPS